MTKYFSITLLLMLSLFLIATGCSSGTISTETTVHDAGTTTVITTVIKTITKPLLTPNNVILSFSGLGDGNTPSFSVSTSPWILQYSTDFSGTFTIYLEGDNSEKLIDGGIHAGELYENYIYNINGSSMYFRVVSNPPGGGWTLTVLGHQ